MAASRIVIIIYIEIMSLQSLKRQLLPEDIANMALYLASDQAGYITGQTIAIDGGMTTF